MVNTCFDDAFPRHICLPSLRMNLHHKQTLDSNFPAGSEGH